MDTFGAGVAELRTRSEESAEVADCIALASQMVSSRDADPRLVATALLLLDTMAPDGCRETLRAGP